MGAAGAGLGLYTSNTICKKLQGKLSVDPSPDPCLGKTAFEATISV